MFLAHLFRARSKGFYSALRTTRTNAWETVIGKDLLWSHLAFDNPESEMIRCFKEQPDWDDMNCSNHDHTYKAMERFVTDFEKFCESTAEEGTQTSHQTEAVKLVDLLTTAFRHLERHKKPEEVSSSINLEKIPRLPPLGSPECVTILLRLAANSFNEISEETWKTANKTRKGDLLTAAHGLSTVINQRSVEDNASTE